MSLSRFIFLTLACLPVGVQAQVIETPSGNELTLHEVLFDPEDGIARLRFIAPPGEEGAPLQFVDVAEDFAWLCETVGLPTIQASELAAGEIVVSIADRVVPFGTRDPDAQQFFEGFSVTGDGRCEWEPF